MQYISTKSTGSSVTLSQAVGRCVAPDGGMYMPERIPLIPRAFYNNISEMNLREIAYVVCSSFFGDDVPGTVLKSIVDEAFAFDAPLVRIAENKYVLELFNGPTLTFKDYGARFLARLMRHLDGSGSANRNVLIATTGNTGAAAASGLLGIDGISVSVLYPKGYLSRSQTAQFTGLGSNIHPLEVIGSVEDCKRLVQQAMADSSFEAMNLTGANSINIARLIPQITFSIYAYAQLLKMGVANADKALYSMPCGNCSNLVAAAMAKRMGLPTSGFIAATNVNNQIAPLLHDGTDTAHTTPARTLAPSCDMSYPSGWPRLEYIYNANLAAMRRDIATYAVTDTDIHVTINDLRARSGYTIDPHGAMALAAADALAPADVPAVIFATGHPAKQLDIMTKITGSAIELPVQLTRFMALKRHSTIIPPTLPALKKHLTNIN